MTTIYPDEVRKECRHFYAVFAASQFFIDAAIWSFYLVQHCGLSLTQAVTFNAAITAVSGILDLPTGSWADRFGRRKIVALGFLSRAIFAVLMIFMPTTTGLVLAALFAGFGWAQLSGAAEALFHDNVKALGHEHNFKHCMANAVIVNYTSRAIAFALSGFLFVLHPTLPYWLLAAAMLSGAALTLSLQERSCDRPESGNDLQHIKAGACVFWITPYLFGCAILILVTRVSSEQLWFSFQPFLTSVGAGAEYSGLSYAVASLGSISGAYVAKKLLRVHRDELALLCAVLCLSIGAACFVVATTPQSATIAQLITCGGFGAFWAASSGILNAYLPSSHRAVCLSILSACETAIMGVLGCFVGYVFEHYSGSIIPIAVVCVNLCVIPCLYKRMRQLKTGPHRD